VEIPQDGPGKAQEGDGHLIVRNGHRPVAGARVTLFDAQGNAVASRETSGSGRYEFGDLAQGEYWLVATGGPPAARTARLTVTAGGVASHDIVLRDD
jgi:hypothetical protein